MSYQRPSQPKPGLRHPSMGPHDSASTGQSRMLVARINEKKAELENLKQLRDLSGGLAAQMQALEEKLSTLSEGTEAVAAVLSNWHNVLRAINMASMKMPKPSSGDDEEKSGHISDTPLPQTLEKVAKDEVLPQPQKVSLWRFHAESDLHLYFGSGTGIKNLCTETLRQLSCDAKARKEVALNTGLAGCYVNISASRASESPTKYRCFENRQGTCWHQAGSGPVCKGNIIQPSYLTTMPRITRAALRSIEHQDGSDIAATIPLPQTPIKDRVPLGETTGNKGARSEPASISEEQAAPAKKGTGKGKKGNTAKKANKKTREKAEDADAGVLEDESQSMHSSAAEEARQDLLKDGSQGMLHITLAFDYLSKVVFDNDRSQTPPSAAANTASQQLSPKPTTPNLDCEMHKPDDTTTSEGKDKQEDSFLSKIESRTPLRMTNGEGIDIPLKGESDKDDSSVEQIKARTPGKRVSRIEDSVEALDVLEEDIEKVGGLIPASVNGLASPIKAKKQAKPPSTTTDSDPSGPVRTKKSHISQKKVQIRRPSTAVGPAASNPSAEASNTRARPSTGLAQQKYDAATQAADSTHKRSQAISQASLKKRISSVHKAPFQPIKSTKPPTRPNFELPGEAVARKLKEQREERSKREEEDAAKPRVFKARPLRRSHAPEVKLTATTKARLSMARGEPINSTRSSNGLNKSKPVPRPSLMAKASPGKSLSTLSVAKQSTPPTAGGPTRPSARHTRGPSFNDSVMMRAPSALGANRPAPTAEESAHQKLKGKEVFGRTKVEIAEREKVKREKEDAARKARADAAERGRIASRAWAEKQKARKLEAGKVNEQGKAGGA